VRMLVQGSFYSGSAVLSPDYFPLLIKIGIRLPKVVVELRLKATQIAFLFQVMIAIDRIGIYRERVQLQWQTF